MPRKGRPPVTPETHRALTEEEYAHVARLLWRTTQEVLAARIQCAPSTVSVMLRHGVINVEFIKALVALKLDDFESVRYRKRSGGYNKRVKYPKTNATKGNWGPGM
jgi:intein-encoded DNA endonuclease-like protein